MSEFGWLRENTKRPIMHLKYENNGLIFDRWSLMEEGTSKWHNSRYVLFRDTIRYVLITWHQSTRVLLTVALHYSHTTLVITVYTHQSTHDILSSILKLYFVFRLFIYTSRDIILHYTTPVRIRHTPISSLTDYTRHITLNTPVDTVTWYVLL